MSEAEGVAYWYNRAKRQEADLAVAIAKIETLELEIDRLLAILGSRAEPRRVEVLHEPRA